MADKILHKRSLTPGNAPTTSSLEIGELAINVNDGKLYLRQSGSIADKVVNVGESASFAATASYVQTAQTASYVLNAVSSSFATSSSFALTASYVAGASSFPFTGSALITGSLGVTGSLTATQIGAGAAPSGSVRLDVRASSSAATDIAFRIRNSANTQNLMSIAGNGDVAIGLNASGVTVASYPFIAIGLDAKASQYGVSIGAGAGANQDNGDRRNIYIGANAGFIGTNVTATANIGIGNNALRRISGNFNICVGNESGLNMTSGVNNNAFGYQSAYNVTEGTGNSFFGTNSGQGTTTGNANTAIGTYNDFFGAGTKSYNTTIGCRLRSTHDGTIMIGTSGDINSTVVPSIADDAAQFHFRSANQSFFFNKNTNVVLRSQGSMVSGSNYDTNATNTLTVHSGSNPTTTISSSFQLYASTGSISNNVRPHFRTGNGTIVWLGDESRLFNVTASRTIISSSQNTISGSSLTVYGSGSTQPVFTVQGSQGELFSVTDQLSGSLFSVNDISGLPILEVFSDNTTLIGNYLDPMLITTAKVTQTNSGSFVVYSLPTASYDTAFFEYSVKSGSNARAGTIIAIQSGSSVNFTETTTLDFGSTTAISFTVVVTGSNMALTGSSTTGSWTIKSIVRGI